MYKCKGHRYRCRKTGKYFNVRTNTLFEASNIKLQKWFLAIWLITSHKKGECFWGILKRGVLGIYHFASKKHLQNYLDEFVFRYNTRYMDEQDKFETLLSHMTVRTRYKELIHA